MKIVDITSLPNLAAEMTRYGVELTDIQNLLGCTEKDVCNKFSGATEFSIAEALQIRNRFFPDFRIDYLFAQ